VDLSVHSISSFQSLLFSLSTVQTSNAMERFHFKDIHSFAGVLSRNSVIVDIFFVCCVHLPIISAYLALRLACLVRYSSFSLVVVVVVVDSQLYDRGEFSASQKARKCQKRIIKTMEERKEDELRRRTTTKKCICLLHRIATSKTTREKDRTNQCKNDRTRYVTRAIGYEHCSRTRNASIGQYQSADR
jgi:hypothetical protein